MPGEVDGRDAVDVLEELLGENDLFRLVIRGFALISEELDEAVANAFGGPIPSELSRLRLPARLALAEALGAVTPELSVAIQRLGKIRHRLAHRVAGEATERRYAASGTQSQAKANSTGSILTTTAPATSFDSRSPRYGRPSTTLVPRLRFCGPRRRRHSRRIGSADRLARMSSRDSG
jgi:hypothetical protein